MSHIECFVCWKCENAHNDCHRRTQSAMKFHLQFIYIIYNGLRKTVKWKLNLIIINSDIIKFTATVDDSAKRQMFVAKLNVKSISMHKSDLVFDSNFYQSTHWLWHRAWHRRMLCFACVRRASIRPSPDNEQRIIDETVSVALQKLNFQ